MKTRDLIHWLNPWPLAFKGKSRRTKWRLHVETIGWCGRNLSACWHVGEQYRRIDWWTNRFDKYTGPAEQHMIHSLARHWCPVASHLEVIVLHRGRRRVVYDGTHRIIAAHLVKALRFHGIKTPLTHVLVIEEI